MTEKDDPNGEGWLPGPSAGDRRSPEEDDAVHQNDPFTREEWERLDSDPDPEEALGYEFCEWEKFGTLDGSEAIMFLPGDENLLREDSFVVADKDDVVDLGKSY